MPSLSHAVRTCFDNRQEPVTARPRILIADADENLLENYERYFVQRAWSLATAISGVDCLEKLRFFTPDVLVLEPEIPWGGGSGVLAHMRDNAVLSQVPVIVVTKAWDSEDVGPLTRGGTCWS